MTGLARATLSPLRGLLGAFFWAERGRRGQCAARLCPREGAISPRRSGTCCSLTALLRRETAFLYLSRIQGKEKHEQNRALSRTIVRGYEMCMFAQLSFKCAGAMDLELKRVRRGIRRLQTQDPLVVPIASKALTFQPPYCRFQSNRMYWIRSCSQYVSPCLQIAAMSGRKPGVIALFDVDGTLTVPRNAEDANMKDFMAKLREKVAWCS